MRTMLPLDPVRQVVGIRIGGIKEATLLHHQRRGVLRTAAEIPAERAFACHLRVQIDGAMKMRALLGRGRILVLDPFVAVAGDFPARAAHRGRNRRRAGQRGRHAINGDRDVAPDKQPLQAPEPGPRAILVDRLHVQVALRRPGLRTDDLREKRLGCGIAMQNAVLAAFLVIEDDLHRDAGIAGPGHARRMLAVTNKVARIVDRGLHCWAFPLENCRTVFARRPVVLSRNSQDVSEAGDKSSAGFHASIPPRIDNREDARHGGTAWSASTMADA